LNGINFTVIASAGRRPIGPGRIAPGGFNFDSSGSINWQDDFSDQPAFLLEGGSV
jgi:hypothetical protein